MMNYEKYVSKVRKQNNIDTECLSLKELKMLKEIIINKIDILATKETKSFDKKI